MMHTPNEPQPTPDWDIQHVIHVTQAEFDRLMADDPDEDARVFHLRRKFMPASIVLGEN